MFAKRLVLREVATRMIANPTVSVPADCMPLVMYNERVEDVVALSVVVLFRLRCTLMHAHTKEHPPSDRERDWEAPEVGDQDGRGRGQHASGRGGRSLTQHDELHVGDHEKTCLNEHRPAVDECHHRSCAFRTPCSSVSPHTGPGAARGTGRA